MMLVVCVDVVCGCVVDDVVAVCAFVGVVDVVYVCDVVHDVVDAGVVVYVALVRVLLLLL